MISPLLFVASFMFLASLLLLGVIYSRIHWVLKAMLVTMSLAFAGFFYVAFNRSLGYPTSIRPSQHFEFIASVIREPSIIHHDPGAIYIWLMEDGMPRAIALPFTTENRRTLSKAEESKDGQLFMSLHKPQSMHPDRVPYDVTGDPIIEIEIAPDSVPQKSTRQQRQ